MTLVGSNDQGRSAGQFTTTTSYVAAQLNKYIPGDPYRQAAENYNGALLVATSDGGFTLQQSIATLASLGASPPTTASNTAAGH